MKTTDIFYNDFPTKEQMKGAIAGAESSIIDTRESAKKRMENYYNCMDDYSYGGICDQAASQNISGCNFRISAMEAQIKKGSPFINDYGVSVLTDLEGNIVSERIVSGRFGYCWIINSTDGGVSFVSLAKKATTYEKKGFKVMNKIFTVEDYCTTRVNKNGAFFTKSRILKASIVDIEQLPTSEYDSRQPSVVYFAENN